jgi:hypothetical protein
MMPQEVEDGGHGRLVRAPCLQAQAVGHQLLALAALAAGQLLLGRGHPHAAHQDDRHMPFVTSITITPIAKE